MGTQLDEREDEETIKRLQAHRRSPFTYKQGHELGEKIGAVKYLECSALTGEGVNDVFVQAVRAALMGPQQHTQKKKEQCVVS